MRKTILTILIITLLLITGCATTEVSENTGGEDTTPAEKEPVKIGVITPLTGDISTWGEAVRRGLELAYKDIRKESNIELIYEDSQCDTKTGINSVNKLLNIDKVDMIIGTVCSSVTLGVAPIVEENKVPLLSIGSSSPEISKAGDYIFRMWPSDSYEAKVLADFMINEEIEDVGVLYLNNDYGLHMKNRFKEIYENKGGEIKIIESFEQDSKDFKTELTKIKDSETEAILFIANPGEAPLILKQIKELNIETKVFANGWVIEDEEVMKSAGDSAEGVIYAMPSMEASDEFQNRIKKEYRETSNPLVTALSYDGLKILKSAINDCRKEADCIKKELYSMEEHKGVAGITIFDENGDVINKPYSIKTVKNGEFIEYR